MAKTALFVMDIQEDFVGDGARMPIAKHQIMPMIDKANQVIRQARLAGHPVYYIGNEFPKSQFIANWFRNYAAVEGTPGTRFDSRIQLIRSHYYAKKQGDALTNPQLAEELVRQEVDHIVITGLYAEGCVAATVKSALARGYKVTVIEDAIGSKSDRRRESALQTFKSKGAETMRADQLNWSEPIELSANRAN